LRRVETSCLSIQFEATFQFVIARQGHFTGGVEAGKKIVAPKNTNHQNGKIFFLSIRRKEHALLA
jgi:hypothetical protein